MAKLNIYMTIKRTIDVDIEDGIHTEEEIGDIAHKAAAASVPSYCSEFDLEWEKDPTPINKTHIPSDQYWLKIGDREVATNSVAMVFRDYGHYPDFTYHQAWISPSNLSKSIPMLEDILIKTDFAKLPLSKAKFAPAMKFYKSFEGLEVRSKDDRSICYFILGGELVAAIMPLDPSSSGEDIVTFN